jgi:stress response protein YsnF
MPTLQDVKSWSGQDAVGPDGEKVGALDHIYLDRQTGEPTFAAVKTGLFGSNVSLVPVEGARSHDGHVHLAFDKAKIKDAPNVEADGELSEAEEARLYEYYGIAGYSQYEGPDHDTIAEYDRSRPAVGQDTSGPTTDDAMTRSEEELRVGKAKQEVGRARLRKYIVTENVTTTVPVEREEVRIEREPITDANRGDAYDGRRSARRSTRSLQRRDPGRREGRRGQGARAPRQGHRHREVEVDETVRKEQIETDGDTGVSGR